MKNKIIKPFIDWWELGPLILTIWFTPIVLIIWLIAIIKNKFQGEK